MISVLVFLLSLTEAAQAAELPDPSPAICAMNLGQPAPLREYFRKAMPMAPVFARTLKLNAATIKSVEEEPLGKGNFGVVYRVQAKLPGERKVKRYALKVYKPEAIYPERRAVDLYFLAPSLVMINVLGELGVTPKLHGIFVGDELVKLRKAYPQAKPPKEYMNPAPLIAVLTEEIRGALDFVTQKDQIVEALVAKQKSGENLFEGLVQRVTEIEKVLQDLRIESRDDQIFYSTARAKVYLTDLDFFKWHEEGLNARVFGRMNFSDGPGLYKTRTLFSEQATEDRWGALSTPLSESMDEVVEVRERVRARTWSRPTP